MSARGARAAVGDAHDLGAVLAALDAGDSSAPLSPPLERLVTGALATRDRAELRVASRALRALVALRTRRGAAAPRRALALLDAIRAAGGVAP